MNTLTLLDWVALILVIVGAINWGLIGWLKFDLVKTIFGDMSMISRVVYAVVGVAGLYLIVIASQLTRK